MTLQILMPMAGKALRFKSSGVLQPKPLIEVDGVPMFKRALSGLSDLNTTSKVIGVILECDDSNFFLAEMLRRSVPKMKIMKIESSRSSVETCMFAEAAVDPALPLLVLDCDFSFESRDFVQAISNPEALRARGIDGVNLWFRSASERYSHAELDSMGLVRRFEEKNAISEFALAGAYYFRVAGHFFDSGRKVLRQACDERLGEHYVSQVCAAMLKAGHSFIALPTQRYSSFGTPEEMAQ